LAQVTQKGSNSTLIKKRLDAHKIGLTVLESVWNRTPHPYTQEEIAGAHAVLSGLMPTVQKVV